MKNEYLTIPLDKKEQSYIRHKWHTFLLTISTIVTVITILVGIISLGFLQYVPSIEKTLIKLLGEEVFNIIYQYIGFIILFPFVFLLMRIINSHKLAATGVLASKSQFEHVYLISEYYSKLAGLKYVPKVAIVGGADFTAKSISNFGEAIILVHSDLLDAPRPYGRDWGALRFAIAREIGHIKAGHRDVLYAFKTFITQSVPYLSHPLSRAEEYTADRYAAALAPEAAADYFSFSAVSKDCWLDMSIKAAVARAGKVRLGQMITGNIGKKPPIVWRVQSLAKFGIFKLDPVINYSESNEKYVEFLKSLPMLTIKIEDFINNNAAFVIPPKPLDANIVDELCKDGTNNDIFDRINLNCDK